MGMIWIFRFLCIAEGLGLLLCAVVLWIKLRKCEQKTDAVLSRFDTLQQNVMACRPKEKARYVIRLWKTTDTGRSVCVDYIPLDDWAFPGTFCERLLKRNIPYEYFSDMLSFSNCADFYSLSADRYNPDTDRYDTFWRPNDAEIQDILHSVFKAVINSPEYLAWMVIPELHGTSVLRSDYAPVVDGARNLLTFIIYAIRHTQNRSKYCLYVKEWLLAVQDFLADIDPHQNSNCAEMIQKKAMDERDVQLDKTAWEYFTAFKDSGDNISDSIFYLKNELKQYLSELCPYSAQGGCMLCREYIPCNGTKAERATCAYHKWQREKLEKGGL